MHSVLSVAFSISTFTKDECVYCIDHSATRHVLAVLAGKLDTEDWKKGHS